MMTLIVGGPSGGARTLVDAFQNAGHTVQQALTYATGLEIVARGGIDVAVAPLGDLPLQALAGAVRKQDGCYCYVLGVLAHESAAAREAAVEAGADGVVLSSATERELAGRVRAIERIVGRERWLRERVSELENDLGRLSSLGPNKQPALRAVPGRTNFLLTRTWRDIEATCSRMCAEYLQLPSEPIVAASLPPPEALGATISLFDVERELQLDLAVFAPGRSPTIIATAFCGGDASLVNDEVIDDVLRELANSAMGAVKGAFVVEQINFTGGIPKTVSARQFTTGLIDPVAHRVLGLRAGEAILNIVLSLRNKPRSMVAAAQLKEGMILASDVLTDSGLLLARAGTRLTQTTAEKLARLIPNNKIELGEAA
jgi:DNA-binding NarL/FixJ family response regulator